MPEDLGDVDLCVDGEATPHRQWELMCDLAFEASPAIACVMEQARLKPDGDEVEVFLGRRYLLDGNLERLQAYIDRLSEVVLGAGVNFKVLEDTEQSSDVGEQTAREKARVYTAKKSGIRNRLLEHSAVQEAIELFNPEKIDVAVWVNPDAIRD